MGAFGKSQVFFEEIIKKHETGNFQFSGQKSKNPPMNLGGNEYWGYAQSLDLFALINTERLL